MGFREENLAGPPRIMPCAPSANEYKDTEMLHVIAYLTVDGGEGRVYILPVFLVKLHEPYHFDR